MGANEMLVGSPPFDMQKQMFMVLSERPGLAHQGSNAPADRQVDPFNESGLDEGCKAVQGQERIEIFSFPPQHTHGGKFGSTSFVTLLDKLTV